jgi:glucosylceramidase
MPACLWGQEYEIEFIAQHLGPALEAAGLPTKIWLLDHNYNLWGRVICSLDVADVRKHCSDVAWHGYVGSAEMVSRVHAAHPEVSMHWTEGGPDYTSPKYASDWSAWAQVCTEALNHWCSSITAWNLALDEKGRPNIGPFPCGGMVTIHSQTREITRSGQHRAFSHFSRSLQRGARRFASKSDGKTLSHVAFENPNGQRLLIVTNPASACQLAVHTGNMSAQLPLESDSVTTLAWKG